MGKCGCKIIGKFLLTDLKTLKIVRCMPVLVIQKCIEFFKNARAFDKKGSKKFRQKKLVSIDICETAF